MLTTATGSRAQEIAAWLEAQNRQRQAAERKMVEIAREQIERRKSSAGDSDVVLVAAHESFHAGVVGIVASRLVDLYHRPVFVLAENHVEFHGSARSIPGFPLHLAIEHVRDLLTSGGGHAMAGGVRLPLKRFEAFREKLNAYALERLTPEQLTPAMPVDAVLEPANCSPQAIAMIERLEPFGRGNPRPRFLIRNVRLTAPPRRVGPTGAHLQLTVSRGDTEHLAHRCIAFKMGDLEPQLPVGTDLNLVVEPRVETWQGRHRVGFLEVIDIARCDDEPLRCPDPCASMTERPRLAGQVGSSSRRSIRPYCTTRRMTSSVDSSTRIRSPVVSVTIVSGVASIYLDQVRVDGRRLVC